MPGVLLASGNGPAPLPGTGIFKTGRSRTLTMNATAFSRRAAPPVGTDPPCPFTVTGMSNGAADGSVSGPAQLSIQPGFYITSEPNTPGFPQDFIATIEGAVFLVMEGKGYQFRLGGGVRQPMTLADTPLTGFVASVPWGGTANAYDLTVDATFIKTLVEYSNGSDLTEQLAGGSWSAFTTAISGQIGFYWAGHMGNAWNVWTASGSASDSRNLTLALPGTAGEVDLRAHILVTASGAVGGQAAELAVSGPGVVYTATASGTSPDGHLSASGSASGILSVDRAAGGLDAQVDWFREPDWALNWALTNKDYRDGSDVNPATYLRSDGGTPAARVSATGTNSLDYPGGGAVEHYSELDFTSGTGGPTTGPVSGAVLFGRPDYFGGGSPTDWFALVDEAWADSYPTLLDSANFVGNNKFYVPQLGPTFDVATLRVDSSHDFAWPVVAGNWSPAGGGITSITQEGAAVKYVVAFTGVSVTASGSRNLKYFAYRFLQLHAKASVDGFTFTLRLRLAGTNFFWNVTLGTAGSYQTVELDLGFPDSQNSPEKWPLHPGAYGTGGASVLITPGTVGTLWIDQWHGTQKSGSGRAPLLLIQPLSSDATLNALLPRHTTTPATDESALANLDTPLNDDRVGGNFVQPGGALWAKLIANGILGVDFRGDPGNLLGLGVSLKDQWTALRLALDNDALGNFGGTANDSGIHVTPDTSAQTLNWQQQALHRTGYPLAGGGPWAAGLAADSEVPVKACVRRSFRFGYYGSGSGPGGGYGATLVFAAEKVWNGEVLGNVGRSGVTVQLADQDGGAVVASGVSNADGLYRVPYHYGAVFTYSNLGTAGARPLPLGAATVAQRQHYTGTPPTSYDSTGQGLNDWRLKAPAKWKDGSGFVLSSSGGVQRKAPLFDRFATWLDILVVVTGGVANIVLPLGTYLRAHTDSGNIIVDRAEILPPFTMTATAIGDGTASDPVFFWDRYWRPHLLVSRGADVHELYSDDDGETWSAPVAAITGGKYPDSAVDPLAGTILRAAVVGSNIKGTLQEAGAASAGALFTFVDQAGAALVVADDRFSLSWGRDGSERLLLTVTISGDAAPSDWYGADGLSWKRFP